MPYSLVLERASGTHIYSVQQELSLLTSTCSVVCLLPQVHSNKLRLAALEALCFILFGALLRSGKEWSYICIMLFAVFVHQSLLACFVRSYRQYVHN